MPRFAANLLYLFTEVPFFERFELAAKCGFKAVEFHVPYDWPVKELSAALTANQLDMVLMDTQMGHWSGGERGYAAVLGKQAEFRASLDRTIEYASSLGCKTVHVMAGVVQPGMDRGAMEQVYIKNLATAAERFKPYGIRAVVEPINNRLGITPGQASYTTQGMLGYLINTTEQAVKLIEQANHDNVFLHLDCYHMQLMEGHLAETLRLHMPHLQHVQIAGVPGRHEPDVGEINYPFIFDLLDELGYQGWIGCEYRPRTTTLVGLGWAAAYGISAKKQT